MSPKTWKLEDFTAKHTVLLWVVRKKAEKLYEVDLEAQENCVH